MIFLFFVFSEVKDLIRKCLAIRPSERPLLEDILNHPWLAPSSDLSVDKLSIRTPNHHHHCVDAQSMSSQESI